LLGKGIGSKNLAKVLASSGVAPRRMALVIMPPPEVADPWLRRIKMEFVFVRTFGMDANKP
jgi:hypothetical protein